MKKIYIIALVAAIACGVLIYTFLSSDSSPSVAENTGNVENVGSENTSEKVTEESDVVSVVVASKDIKKYKVIKANMLNVVSIPKSDVYKDAFTETKEVVGKVAEYDFVEGEPILASKVSENDGTGGSLAYEIPDGMRAMDITVNRISGVGGFIKEGDLVDVLLIVDASPKTENDNDYVKVKNKIKTVKSTATQIVASAVQVVRLSDVAKTDGEGVSTCVTLLLTPKQCKKVLTAEKIGEVRLTLRGKTDNKIKKSDSIDSGDAFVFAAS